TQTGSATATQFGTLPEFAKQFAWRSENVHPARKSCHKCQLVLNRESLPKLPSAFLRSVCEAAGTCLRGQAANAPAPARPDDPPSHSAKVATSRAPQMPKDSCNQAVFP